MSPKQVECAACDRKQLRWSEEQPNGLLIEELEAVGWVRTGDNWLCHFCRQRALNAFT